MTLTFARCLKNISIITSAKAIISSSGVGAAGGRGQRFAEGIVVDSDKSTSRFWLERLGRLETKPRVLDAGQRRDLCTKIRRPAALSARVRVRDTYIVIAESHSRLYRLAETVLCSSPGWWTRHQPTLTRTSFTIAQIQLEVKQSCLLTISDLPLILCLTLH